MRHCTQRSALVANIAIIYMLTCIFYLAYTNAYVSTPFADSLTEEQRTIKMESASIRGRVFAFSAIVSTYIVWYQWKPFQ